MTKISPYQLDALRDAFAQLSHAQALRRTEPTAAERSEREGMNTLRAVIAAVEKQEAA